MARPSKRNISWNNFTRSRKSQMAGFVDAMRLVGKSDEEIRQAAKKLDPKWRDCTCHFECGKDSHPGEWHQHENEPCPVHPDAPMVG